jgi:hypothetical protein
MAVDARRVSELRRAFADDRGRIIAPTIERVEGRVRAIPMPSHDEILRLPDDQLAGILQRFGVLPKWTDYYNGSADYVMRMSRTLSPLSTDPANREAFWAEVDRLAATESRRHLIGAVRRAQEQYTTQRVLEGTDPGQEFIRILDSHDNQCEACIARAGIIGTYEEHVAVGLPGASSCFGGDYCRCQLVPID